MSVEWFFLRLVCCRLRGWRVVVQGQRPFKAARDQTAGNRLSQIKEPPNSERTIIENLTIRI